MGIYTSEDILKMDDLYDLQFGIVNYQLTKGELGWLEFIKGKYSIADYIYEHTEDGIFTIESGEMSRVLDEDCKGLGKAVMLSDDSGLQRLFFWLYMEEEE